MKEKRKEDSVDYDLFNKLTLDDIINDSSAYVPQSGSDQGQDDGEFSAHESLFSHSHDESQAQIAQTYPRQSSS